MANSAPNNVLLLANSLQKTNSIQAANSGEGANQEMVSTPPQTVIVNPGSE